MANIEKFVPKNGQVVTAQGHEGTFKVLNVSEDGQKADIQPFSLSRQMLIGAAMRGVPCSTLHHFKEDASQAAARIVKEAAKDKQEFRLVMFVIRLNLPQLICVHGATPCVRSPSRPSASRFLGCVAECAEG